MLLGEHFCAVLNQYLCEVGKDTRHFPAVGSIDSQKDKEDSIRAHTKADHIKSLTTNHTHKEHLLLAENDTWWPKMMCTKYVLLHAD